MVKFSLRLRVFLFFAALAVGALLALGAGGYLGYYRLGDPSAANGFIIGGVTASFVIFGLIAGVWVLFDEHVAKPIERLAGGLRARTHADVSTEFDTHLGRYLGDLAPAAAAVAENLGETRSALNDAVLRETLRLSSEKERLEALLSDVPVGVLLCTPSHQLAFYNSQAVDILGGMDASGQGPGLDRRVFEYLNEPPIRHAYERLIEARDADAASDLLCATRADGRVIAARMRLLADMSGTKAAAQPGYVLTLRDVSADMAAHSAREVLMDELFDRIRRPAAAIQSLIGVLTDEDGPQGAARDKVREAARAEAGHLASAIHDLGERHEASRADWWPLAMIRASDLADAVRARVALEGGDLIGAAGPLMLRCDGFEIVALISKLVGELAAQDGTRKGFRLEISEDGAGAMLAIEWDGPAASISELERWLDLPLSVGVDGVTGRRVLATHAAQIWPERIGSVPIGFDQAGTTRARLCLPLREARRAVKPARAVPRSVVYDFDLLHRARNTEVAAARLEDLTYVVFDTETTGLFPMEGDEICQIAAVRIVNGRRVATETFDTLVNPARKIPRASTEVHGITDAMVAGAPEIAEVGARFHRFAQGAVLVAHNAPFDMEFLRRKEAVIGAEFDHPVLDTVLLSAIVFGQSEVHSLDALTHRLGITIPQEARHTAIGDTVATAEAFLKLLPALKARGITTFGEAVSEMRKHGRLLKDLNG
jgi:DNA polymerase-3 subunit epsilon